MLVGWSAYLFTSVVLLLVALLLLSFLIQLRMAIEWQKITAADAAEASHSIQIRLLHWPHVAWQILPTRRTTKNPFRISNKGLLHLKHWFHPRDFLESFFNGRARIKVEQFRLELALGTGDAMGTALLLAMIHTVIFLGTGVASGWVKWNTQPHVTIRPIYTRPHLSGHFVCIFRFRLGDIMVAAAHMFRKGVQRSWSTLFRA